MSEIAQGALIMLGGTVLGALITAIIAYKIAKQQINASREALIQQLSHQEREARINRLIEARKDHLSQLSKIISEYVECSHQEINMGVRLLKAIQKKDPIIEQQETSEFFNVAERGKQLTSQLEILRGQLSDSILDNFIEALLNRQLEINTARMPIIRFLNNPKGADSSTIESAMKKEESLRSIQRKAIIKINKRIEELQSGEPSQ